MSGKFVRFPVKSVSLEGELSIPANAPGLVIFVHGSGSSRRSPRNRYVAQVLNDSGLGTFLFDLLTVDEEKWDEATNELRFDIPLLAERLVGATEWLVEKDQVDALTLGYFGASTGAAAALMAAAEHPGIVHAIVSRGGRPDLAGEGLEKITTPTLLIVGAEDYGVIELNEEALNRLRTHEKRLEMIAGATHLFEEPGTLEQVAELARSWFHYHLSSAGEPRAPLKAKLVTTAS